MKKTIWLAALSAVALAAFASCASGPLANLLPGGGGSSPQQAAAAPQQPAPPTLEEQIIGSWVAAHNPAQMFRFNANGTVDWMNANTGQVLANMPFTVAGNLLFQEASVLGAPDMFVYFSIEGNELIYHDDPEGNVNRVYHRRR
jgi:hypothetical protein